MHLSYKFRFIVWIMVLLLSTGSFPGEIRAKTVAEDDWLTDEWSWVFWWEANRGAVLQGKFLKKVDEPAPVRADASLERAGAGGDLTKRLLTVAADSTWSSDVRTQAVLAVGKMHATGAVEQIIVLTRDRDPAVARTAWVALGLIGGKPAREAILEQDAAGADSTLARIIALGLLRELDQRGYEFLVSAVNQGRSVEVRASALWALRQHDPPFLGRLSQEVLNETAEPRLAVEAILALGNHPESAEWQRVARLYKIYYGTDKDVTPATLAAWEHYTVGRLGITNQRARVETLRTSAVISLGQFQVPRTTGKAKWCAKHCGGLTQK